MTGAEGERSNLGFKALAAASIIAYGARERPGPTAPSLSTRRRPPGDSGAFPPGLARCPPLTLGLRRKFAEDPAVGGVAGSSDDGVIERRFTSGRWPCARTCSSCVIPRGRCARPSRGLDGGAGGGAGELARLPRIVLRLWSCSSAFSAALARLSEGLLVEKDFSESADNDVGRMEVAFAGAWVSNWLGGTLAWVVDSFALLPLSTSGEAGGMFGDVTGNVQFAVGVSAALLMLLPRCGPKDDAEYVRGRPGNGTSEGLGSGRRMGKRRTLRRNP